MPVPLNISFFTCSVLLFSAPDKIDVTLREEIAKIMTTRTLKTDLSHTEHFVIIEKAQGQQEKH